MISQLSFAEAQAKAANDVRKAWEDFAKKMGIQGGNNGNQPTASGG